MDHRRRFDRHRTDHHYPGYSAGGHAALCLCPIVFWFRFFQRDRSFDVSPYQRAHAGGNVGCSHDRYQLFHHDRTGPIPPGFGNADANPLSGGFPGIRGLSCRFYHLHRLSGADHHPLLFYIERDR